MDIVWSSAFVHQLETLSSSQIYVKRSLAATRALAASLVKSAFAIRHRRALIELRSLKADSFWQEQGRRFRDVYERARQDVPYYRDRPDSYPESLGPSSDVRDMLARLPILSKQELRQHNAAFFSTRADRSARVHTTSGTSGTPLRLLRSPLEAGFEQAVREDWMVRTLGLRYPRTLSLSGFFAPQRNSEGVLAMSDIAQRSLFLSIYRLAEMDDAPSMELISGFQPQLAEGYASAMYELARRLPEPLRAPRPAGLTTSEVLSDEWRVAIESRLCSRVYDNYGSQEGAHRVMECDRGAMHIHPAVGVVELIMSEGQSARAGESGRVVVTGLVRDSMPLFRYALGDTATSTGFNTACSCGLEWPTIGRVEGRSEDYAIARDGTRVRYLGFHATKGLSRVIEAQVEQVDLDVFKVRIVAEDGHLTAEEESTVRAELERRMRAPLHVQVDYVDAVPRTARGKVSAFIRSYHPPS